MAFETGDARAKAEVFRYNLATSTAVVPTGLQPGDRYSFTAVQPDDELTEETVGSSELTPLPTGAGFIQGPTDRWTEDAGPDPMDRVLAAAEHLRSEGKYSDGIGRTERIYVAGHSVWRLSDEFVNAPQIVGNDEQYAAFMALAANRLRVPARVVVGTFTPKDGKVQGRDVLAWVELRVRDGSWRVLPTSTFMSNRKPRRDDEPPQSLEEFVQDQLPEDDTEDPSSDEQVPLPDQDPDRDQDDSGEEDSVLPVSGAPLGLLLLARIATFASGHIDSARDIPSAKRRQRFGFVCGG
jgi:hypothetical protein